MAWFFILLLPVLRVKFLQQICDFRDERGWSQEFLAFETGLHRTFITHCERGVRNISLDNIEKIARAFNVPIAELFLPQ